MSIQFALGFLVGSFLGALVGSAIAIFDPLDKLADWLERRARRRAALR